MAAGRLAETFGNMPVNWRDLTVHLRDTRLVDVDLFLRTLRLMWAAERSVAALDDHTPGHGAGAYCDGVNAWLLNRPHRRLPVEYRLLGLDAAPWTLADALSVGKGMAYHLNFAWKTILVQASVSQKLPEHMAADLTPEGYPTEGPYIVPPGMMEGLLDLDTTVRETLGFRGTRGWGATVGCWPGSRTESGYPLVANDPHLRLRALRAYGISTLSAGRGVPRAGGQPAWHAGRHLRTHAHHGLGGYGCHAARRRPVYRKAGRESAGHVSGG